MASTSWRTALRTFLDEPRVEDPPGRDWRDYAMVGVALISLLLETVFRNDISLPTISVPLAALIVVALLWRREYVMPTFVLAFGGVLLFDVTALIAGEESINLYTTVFSLVFMFSLFRWGSGKEARIGTILAFTVGVLANIVDDTFLVGDLIGGLIVLCLPAVFGLAIRLQTANRELEEVSRAQAFEQVKNNERTELARELHDTVAHHVSAIAIQAQAGRFLAKSNSLKGAEEALAVIEEEASRTLTEMRSIIEVLRDSDSPSELAPQHGLADIDSLIPSAATDTPTVTINRTGNLSDIGAAVDAAIYRLTQESITNAVRHASNATRVDVTIDGQPDAIALTVVDDGRATSSAPSTPSSRGFGLIGMNERAALLGGTLHAGPHPDGGWHVKASLPRRAS